jgi:hypothetical protein
VDDAEDPALYFTSRGFEVLLEERDMCSELMATGEHGRAASYREGQTYFCVTLLRSGTVVAANYADAPSADEALARARRRFGSEQT